MAKPNKKGPSAKVNFDDVEAKTTFPEGDYRAKLAKGTLEDGEEHAYISWTWEMVDGKFKGKTLSNHNTSLSPKALWNLRSMLEAGGVTIPEGDFDLNAAWIGEVVDEFNEVIITIEHEKYEGRTQCRVTDVYPIEEAGAIDDKKGAKDKKGESTSSAKEEKAEEPPDFDELDKDELKEFIDEHDLDVDADDFPKLSKLRAAVQAAFEAKEDGGEKSGESYTEDAINDMGTKELQKLVDDEELGIDLDGTTKAKRRAVIKALRKAGKLETE